MIEQPLSALLWDEGTLTRENISPLAGLVSHVTISHGPRQAQLNNLLEKLLPKGTVTDLPLQPTCPEEAVGLLAASAEKYTPLLVAGAPFDSETWVSQLTEALRQSELPGAATLIPGTPDAPLTTVALNREAEQYALLLRAGIASSLDTKVAAAGAPLSGESAAANTIGNQTGPVLLLWSAYEYQEPAPEPQTASVSAADVVHVIMKDIGLEVTNRTDMTTELRVDLGSTSGRVYETLQFSLQPREARLFSAEELGAVAALAAPKPELRQWSHEAEVVYVGGQRRISAVHVGYFLGPQLLGTDSFGGPNSLVTGVVSTEIARAIGRPSRSMGQRLSELAEREDWRTILGALTVRTR